MLSSWFYKAAAVHMKDPLSAQAPRPEVSGLVVPRRPAPRILPQSMGRGKGTVPTNPFSGNWQKASAAPGVPERIGKAVGGFIGKHPVAATAMAYGVYRAPDIGRALKERHDASRSPVGYGTVHALRGLATVGG